MEEDAAVAEEEVKVADVAGADLTDSENVNTKDTVAVTRRKCSIYSNCIFLSLLAHSLLS